MSDIIKESNSTKKYIPHMENIKNTAELLHLPTNFIREKVLTGEIVAVRAGRRYLVNVDKLIEYLNTHTIDPEIEPDEEADNYLCRNPRVWHSRYPSTSKERVS